MLLVHFIGHGGLQGDGAQAQFVEVVAQHRIFIVFGARAERHIHAEAQPHFVVYLMRNIAVRGNHHIISDFAVALDIGRAVGRTGDFAAVGVIGFAIFIFHVRCHDVQVNRGLRALQLGEAGGVVKEGGRVGGFSGR